MNWEVCISNKRYGYQAKGDPTMRSEYNRDYDKIIFLSAFRRLQNKTQVFPLPGNVFVHNRLTHSLEVASVGRSLGSQVGHRLAEKYFQHWNNDLLSFFRYELSGVIASACLAHDIGNPAFGHSGEKAISNFFLKNHDFKVNGSSLRSLFTEDEWSDLIQFEGNANALRILTRHFKGKLGGGQRLMYVTLASIIKYPCASTQVDKKKHHLKKYGYFLSDKAAFLEIMTEFDLQDNSGYKRHPFVYLLEAADDICYTIIDVEDAHRIGILSREKVTDLFLSLLQELGSDTDRNKEILEKLEDNNEAISYLRAVCINKLVERCATIFITYEDKILNGTMESSLMDLLLEDCKVLSNINQISIEKIYNHPSVIEVELAGYNVMSELLTLFCEAVLTKERSTMQKKCIQLISKQYNLADDDVSPYEKVMGVLDYVSGMTDGYATELYRKLKGIDIATHR